MEQEAMERKEPTRAEGREKSGGTLCPKEEEEERVPSLSKRPNQPAAKGFPLSRSMFHDGTREEKGERFLGTLAAKKEGKREERIIWSPVKGSAMYGEQESRLGGV